MRRRCPWTVRLSLAIRRLTRQNVGIAVANGLASAAINNSIVVDSIENNGALSGNHNLLGTSGAFTGGANDITGVSDPKLGPLADNGRGIRTHAVLPGSPALNVGSSSNYSDQRGFTRNVGGVDIGAFERQTSETTNLVVSNISDVSDGNFAAGQLSLREAIGIANLSNGPDSITFDSSLAGQTIRLVQGELSPNSVVTIVGDTNGDNVADITLSGDANGNGTADVGDSRVMNIGECRLG